MGRLVTHNTPLVGLLVIERQSIEDNRGYLERLFCQQELLDSTLGKYIRQVNRSFTKKLGTVRGLHFQYPPHSETKIVSALRGRVWDVAVDLRSGSPTYLKYFSQELSEANRLSLLIPEGFAHGFQTLTDDCEMLYFHTSDYKAEAEGALNVLDPKLGIQWPEPIFDCSERDSNHPMLSESFKGLQIR